MGTVRAFLAGIIQGSSKGSSIHPQDYRDRIKTILQKHCAAWEIIDPVEMHPDSVSYDAEMSAETLSELVDLATESDLLVAYIPEASMGVALEMWECKRADVPVMSTTEMPGNWVVQASSAFVLSSVEEFEEFVRDGDLQKLVASRATAAGSPPAARETPRKTPDTKG